MSEVYFNHMFSSEMRSNEMKKQLITMVVLVSSLALAGLDGPPPPLTPEQVREQLRGKPRRTRPRLSPEEQMKRTGGIATAPYSGNAVRIVNAQTRGNSQEVMRIARTIGRVMRFKIDVVTVSQIPDAEVLPFTRSAARENGTGMVLVLLDTASFPGMLVAPEESWACVNISALSLDHPQDDLLAKRLEKEIWRAFSLTLGAGHSTYQPCLMRPIYSLEDLDACPVLQPCPEPFNQMTSTAKLRGINTIRTTTYKQACIEGWAPTPTNEFQKAIFEQVKADKERGPTNPILIPPPNAKK